ncbi:hypothetical protein DTO217A2_2781 [Paecilomyces variotii]|nr:hypothetical protein DTO217A2_2781 [Paecilomyces variotii]
MVVFVDYDRDTYDDALYPLPEHSRPLDAYVVPSKPLLSKLTTSPLESASLSAQPVSPKQQGSGAAGQPGTRDSEESPVEEQQKPNVNAFSAALSCYPIVKEIAKSVDLNTLHALSRTCRQFRVNLLPYRDQLIKQTLRCENEYIETLSDMLGDGAVLPDNLKNILRLLSRDTVDLGKLTSGKVGRCARDMVSECRRCSRVVCRNCCIKPPSSAMLKNRLRRLCTTCRTAPLHYLLTQYSSSTMADDAIIPSPSTGFTASAFIREPCSCEEAVWLCQPCGQTLRSDDTTYRRVWTWRTRYSTYLGGGLGTGIGEGCQGVKCGRGEHCLAAQEIELEVCDADERAAGVHDHHVHGNVTSHNHERSDSPHVDSLDNRDGEEPGYFKQEIVGIGGVVKCKAKKRVTVGSCVLEYEDERETGKYLRREESGQDRSWCGWCWRVVPGKHDRLEL